MPEKILSNIIGIANIHVIVQMEHFHGKTQPWLKATPAVYQPYLDDLVG